MNGFHPLQQAQHLGQGQIPGSRIVQSRSSAAFKLEAASCGTPACAATTAVPAACPDPWMAAITPRALRRA